MAEPPTPQEVERKLSLRAPPKPANNTIILSGTESDSDTPYLPQASHIASPSSPAKPLFPIAERRTNALSGDETDEDDDEEDDAIGGFRKVDHKRRQGSAEEAAIKSGYLWKKGERRKTWKKRWFVLRPAHLAVYKTSAEYKLLKILDLSEVHSCSSIELKRHQNTFSLVSPYRTFYLQAAEAPDMADWVDAIGAAKESLMATSTITSAETPTPTGGTSQPVPIPTQQIKSKLRQASGASSTTSPTSRYLTSSDSDDASPKDLHILPSSVATTSTGASMFSAASAASSETKTILSGYLMKCGSKRHNWRKRWFVLSNKELVYSASHVETKHQRSFGLPSIVDALEFHPADVKNISGTLSPSQSLINALDDLPKDAHTFKIVTTKRTLVLCAPSEEEEIKWLSAICALIARRGTAHKGITTPSPIIHPPTLVQHHSAIAGPSFEKISGSIGAIPPSRTKTS